MTSVNEGEEAPDPTPVVIPDRKSDSGGEVMPRRVDVGKNMVDNSKVYLNVGQKVVITTRDKLKLSLIDSIPAVTDRGIVIGKASIAVALLLAIFTTDTKDTLGLSAQTWSVLLVIFTAVAVIWTVLDIVRYIRGDSVDDIVEKIIKNSEE